MVAACLACWPIYEIGTVRMLTTSPGRWTAENNTARVSVLLRCVRSLAGDRVEPPRLLQNFPLGNILMYTSRQSGPRPALIDIYGGAWQRGAPGDTARFDSYMALHGFTVFAIDYRHAPAFHFPDQVRDVQAALEFLHSNATQYNVDPNRFILCGRSSGAELALLAAYQAGGIPIRAVISFYGPTDLKSGYWDRPFPDPIDVRAVLRAYLGGSPLERPDAFRDASPVHYVRPSLPPTLLLQGERDHIVKAAFAHELYSKLQASGNRASLLKIPWSEHAFDLVFSGLGNQVCLPYIHDFLQREVGN